MCMAVCDVVKGCVSITISVNPSRFVKNADIAHFTTHGNILRPRFCFYNKGKTFASNGGHLFMVRHTAEEIVQWWNKEYAVSKAKTNISFKHCAETKAGNLCITIPGAFFKSSGFRGLFQAMIFYTHTQMCVCVCVWVRKKETTRLKAFLFDRY